MFQKNIEKLKFKNPSLAEELEKLNLNDIKNIKVYQAESKDYIISYDNVMLHNAVDPIREAKTTWYRAVKSELKKNDIQIVYGLGLGYLFKRAFINSESKIFIFEPFIEILRYVLEYVDFSQELSEDRVFITNNYKDLTQKIQNEYLSGDKIEFLFLNSYMKLKQNLLLELTDQTLKICESKVVDQNTILNQCKFWTQNTLLNMPNYSETRPVGFLKDSFKNKPALIISAGPSLMENIEKIKNNKNKYIIIAVCSALRTLIKHDIIPDFVTYADSRFLHQHIDQMEEYIEKTHLVINSRADNHVFNQKSKSKLIYFSETDSLAEWTEEATDTDIGLDKSGGTVSVMSYYLAKNLGCNPITFAGLDLAFINNKIYANGTEMQVTQNGTLTGIMFDSVKKLTQVKGTNGEMIPTRDDYISFIRQFDEIFTEEKDTSKIINTSLSGAYIKGMAYMSFDDFIKLINDNTITTDYIDTTVVEAFNNTNNKWNSATSTMYQKAKIQNQKIKEIDTKVKYTYAKLQEVCEFLAKPENQIITIQNKIESLQQTLSDLRREVINDPFLSNYLQSEILNYTRAYRINILPGVEDLKTNLKVEMEFYKIVCLATDNISKWIESSFEKYNEDLKVLKV